MPKTGHVKRSVGGRGLHAHRHDGGRRDADASPRLGRDTFQRPSGSVHKAEVASRPEAAGVRAAVDRDGPMRNPRLKVRRASGTILNPRETGRNIKARWRDLEARTTSMAAGISEKGKAQMRRLLDVARRSAAGKRPGGWCYRAVKKYLRSVGYGGLNAQTVSQLPQRAARQFGDFMNRGDNARRYGLQKLPITNPYLAPPGSLVVVRPGTPGTRHPWAGDITVAGGNGRFYNDGNMGYGGSRNFPRGNRHVIGIYAPV